MTQLSYAHYSPVCAAAVGNTQVLSIQARVLFDCREVLYIAPGCLVVSCLKLRIRKAQIMRETDARINSDFFTS